MAYREEVPPTHYVVTVLVKEVTPAHRKPGALAGTVPEERKVEDVLSLSVRGTSLGTALDRARAYLDTEADNLAAEKGQAE